MLPNIQPAFKAFPDGFFLQFYSQILLCQVKKCDINLIYFPKESLRQMGKRVSNNMQNEKNHTKNVDTIKIFWYKKIT